MVLELSDLQVALSKHENGKRLIDNQKLLGESLMLARQYDLTANGYADKWIKWLDAQLATWELKNRGQKAPIGDMFNKWKNELSKNQSQFKKSEQSSNQRMFNAKQMDDIFSTYGAALPDDYTSPMDIDASAPNTSRQQSQTRSETIKLNPVVDFIYNKEVEEISGGNRDIVISKVCSLGPYRYMNDKPANRAEAYELRLESVAHSIVNSKKLEPPSIFHVPIQEDVVAVGRVCPESEGKLIDLVPPVLESSRENGTKVRVRLLVNNLDDYSIFPGQVVALEGRNPTGKLFVISKIYEGTPLPFYQPNQEQSQPLSVVVGCGPWSNLNVTQLNTYLPAFLSEVAKNPPNLLILTGPFVDAQHPQIENFQLEDPFDKVMDQALDVIKNNKELSSTQIIIIPSLRDANHDIVFPQPSYTKSNMPSNIRFLSNPTHFVVNEVSFSVTSVDIIKHLAAEETYKSKSPTYDRIGKLCEHLINQQSIYPLLPADPSVPLDSSRMGHLTFPFTPDVLIVPSDLQSFVKNLNGTICVNPGRVSKGMSAGSFARFSIHAASSPRSKLPDRTRVEIFKL